MRTSWKLFAIVLLVVIGGILAKGAIDYTSTSHYCGTTCHTMEGQYIRWEHSSHRVEDGCVSCHLPQDNYVNYLVRKSIDGALDIYAFTMKDPPDYIQLSQRGADLVQENCIRCHETLITSYNVADEGYCWDCHRGLPHGF